MDEGHVPPPEPSAYNPPPAQPRRHLLRALIPLGLVVVMIIVGLLLADNGAKPSHNSKTYLVVDNTTKSQIDVTDSGGKLNYSLTYPKFSYVNFEAASPNGEILLSRGITSNSESFIWSVNGKAKEVASGAAKALHSAIVLNSSHQIFFTDDNDVVYVTCPAGKTCLLATTNLQTGQGKTIADTGAKPLIPQLPPVYPLGVSGDGKTVYLRTLVTNKLGKTAAAVYAINANGKVTGNWPLDLDASYTPTLSPDSKQIVYKTGHKDTTTLNTLNLGLNKTYKAKWTGGEIANLPSSLSWSPDSKKVYFWGSNGILPRPKADSTFDINTAYLDVTNSRITSLQTTKDSAHNQIAAHGWLDTSSVVYEQDVTTLAYDFTGSQSQVYKQNIGNKAVVKINVNGQLKAVVRY